MQIYALDRIPQMSAQALNDADVKTRGRQAVRLLSAVCRNRGLAAPYPALTGPKNAKWVAWASLQVNYDWLWLYAKETFLEYAYRFDAPHGGLEQLKLLPDPRAETPLPSTFVNATGKTGESVIELYRAYYIAHCVDTSIWSRRRPPNWIGQVYLKAPDTWALTKNTLFAFF